jgi:hypothetical protein
MIGTTMTTDDNSILDHSAPNREEAPSMVATYLGNLMSSIHEALDPSAILTDDAVQAFQQDEPQQPRRRPSLQSQGLQGSRRYMTQGGPSASASKRLSQRSFQPTPRSRRPSPEMTCIDLTNYEQHYTHADVTTKYTDNDYDGDNEDPSLTPNASLDDRRSYDDDDEPRTSAAGSRFQDGMISTAAEQHSNSSSSSRYEHLVQLAVKNTLLMEKMRDQVNQLRVENALLLNDMNMVSYYDNSHGSYATDGMMMETA